MLMYYAFTPNCVFKSALPNGSELTWQTSMLYTDIVPLIYVNKTICMVICPSTRFRSVVVWPRMNCLVPEIIPNYILWVRGLVPFWVLRPSSLSLAGCLLETGNVSKLRDWPQTPHPQHAFWDNIGTRWIILGHEMIDMNLEERQVSKQIYSFSNID